MKVTTSYAYPADSLEVWPLLFGSKMVLPSRSPWFYLGLPKPKECRLASKQGGVGATRECISNRGSITQEITVWKPGERLAFQMVQTNIYFKPCISHLEDEFKLQRTARGETLVTRTTTFEVRGFFKSIKTFFTVLGLHRIHRYVFLNWAHEIALSQ